jgi:hypothetical protein
MHICALLQAERIAAARKRERRRSAEWPRFSGEQAQMCKRSAWSRREGRRAAGRPPQTQVGRPLRRRRLDPRTPRNRVVMTGGADG